MSEIDYKDLDYLLRKTLDWRLFDPSDFRSINSVELKEGRTFVQFTIGLDKDSFEEFLESEKEANK